MTGKEPEFLEVTSDRELVKEVLTNLDYVRNTDGTCHMYSS